METTLKELAAKVGAMKLELIEVASRRDRSQPKMTRKNTMTGKRRDSNRLGENSVDSKLTQKNRTNTILPTGR